VIEIRRVHEADWEELRAVRLEALADEPDAYGSTFAETSALTEGQWRQMAEHWNYYVAFDGAQPIGLASGGLHPPTPEARWLFGMFVTPRHRGTGVARELVSRVANWARGEGVSTLGLHVTSTLTRSRAFYEKCGFVATGDAEPMHRDPTLVLLTMTTDLRSNDRI
jgi:GNAT superfamily N-acetyltransferase